MGNIKEMKNIIKSQSGISVHMTYVCDDINDSEEIYKILKKDLGFSEADFGNKTYSSLEEFIPTVKDVESNNERTKVDSNTFLGSLLENIDDENIRKSVSEKAKELFNNDLIKVGFIKNSSIKQVITYLEDLKKRKEDREAVCNEVIDKLEERKPSREKDKKILEQLKKHDTATNLDDLSDDINESLKKAIGKPEEVDEDHVIISKRELNIINVKLELLKLITNRLSEGTFNLDYDKCYGHNPADINGYADGARKLLAYSISKFGIPRYKDVYKNRYFELKSIAYDIISELSTYNDGLEDDVDHDEYTLAFIIGVNDMLNKLVE